MVTEAARAINDDGGIRTRFPSLAALLDSAPSGEPLVRRVINANLRVGTPDAARRVAAFAARSTADDEMRGEAIAVLGVWPKPSILDRVDGWNLGPVSRDSAAARAVLASIAEPLFANGSTAIQVALADAVGRLRLTSARRRCCSTRCAPARRRRFASPRFVRWRSCAMAHRTGDACRAPGSGSTVRMAALSAIPPLNLPEATTTELLASVVGKGSIAEQQSALAALGLVPGTTAREALTRLVDQLAQGKVVADIQLDVADAARATKHAPLIAKLDELEKSRAGAGRSSRTRMRCVAATHAAARA